MVKRFLYGKIIETDTEMEGQLTDKRYIVVNLGDVASGGDGQAIVVRTSNHGQYISEEGSKRRVAISVRPDYFPEIGAEVRIAALFGH